VSTFVFGYALTWEHVAALSPPVRPQDLAGFVGRGLGVPIMLNHVPHIHSRGVQTTAGAARRWRPDPSGLLVLAELDDTQLGIGLAAAAASGVLGFSVRLVYEHWGETVGVVDITELSLTPEPADSGAVVLAVGERARELWTVRDLVSDVSTDSVDRLREGEERPASTGYGPPAAFTGHRSWR
jgi:hypothetical protein